VRRADDAVEPGLPGEGGEAAHLVERRTALPDAGEIAIVEAGQHGDADELHPSKPPPAASSAADAAAFIMAIPPAQWTVSNTGSSGATARTAPATVLGMSCSLRSRKSGAEPATSPRSRPSQHQRAEAIGRRGHRRASASKISARLSITGSRQQEAEIANEAEKWNRMADVIAGILGTTREEI